MRRVLALTLVWFSFLLLFISFELFIERSQTQIENLPELRRCDKGMCLFSIAPNETTISDAQATLKETQAFTFANFSTRTVFKQSRPFYRVDLASGNCSTTASSCVGEMDSVFPLGQNALTAGQIISEFGLPCTIVPFYLPQRMVLIYPGAVFFFISDLQSSAIRFQPTLPLGQINVFNTAASCGEIVNRTNQDYPWRGFTLYEKNP